MRALAVLPVVLYHAGFDAFAGGFVGVDIFFVISGYLITTILVSEMSQEKFSLINFYERRARRILPALFLVVWLTLTAAWFLFQPGMMRDYGASLVGVSLFASNFVFWLQADYFDTAAELKPLLHTWSLAVEEQFYIFFPLLLLAIFRFARKLLLPAILALCAASLALSIALLTDYPGFTFYMLPTRAWELAIGSLCAIWMQAPDKKSKSTLNNLLAALGLLLILSSIILMDDTIPFPGLSALPVCLGTALVILFARGADNWVARAFSWRPLVVIGLISYSVYLWHLPLMVFARHMSLSEPSYLVMASLSVASIALGWLSWRYVEKPFRDRQRTSRRFIFSSSIVAILSTTGLGYFIFNQGGKLGQDPYDPYEIEFLDYQADKLLLQRESWEPLRALTGDPTYREVKNPREYEIPPNFSGEKPAMLIVGNSFSKDVYNTLSFSETANQAFDLHRIGSRPALLTEDFWNSPHLAQADVVMIANAYREDDFSELPGLIEAFKARGKLVVLVKNIPPATAPIADRTRADLAIVKAYLAGERDGDAIAARIARTYAKAIAASNAKSPDSADRIIDGLAKSDPKVIALARIDYACSPDRQACWASDERLNKFYFDEYHHTLAGARFFANRIDEIDWLEEVREAVSK